MSSQLVLQRVEVGAVFAGVIKFDDLTVLSILICCNVDDALYEGVVGWVITNRCCSQLSN